ncbi:MAG TPA: hypothetical protein VK096_01195, partial [Actinomycetales bacterium]|nr:hypothetical protein [Actinomycetales bacterium]
LQRAADGTRRVEEVVALTSKRQEDYQIEPIMRFVPEPIGPDRVVTGEFVYKGLPRDLTERLQIAGEVAPGKQQPA